MITILPNRFLTYNGTGDNVKILDQCPYQIEVMWDLDWRFWPRGGAFIRDYSEVADWIESNCTGIYTIVHNHILCWESTIKNRLDEVSAFRFEILEEAILFRLRWT